ncbi:hypothetical protein [Conexibacter sp. SYSU D00693]|uniref:hypothetical protein n=1 Tax=Conexibacter sp. SYSU D00693 TaxID=2812560 RepID=UPI00196A806F|nr:hypothetical protein [Conexibacter sp. SYSU D00693]
MGPFAAVVVDALAAPPDPELRDRLGPELHDRLRAVLRERACAWAREVAGERAGEAAGARALGALLEGHDGPVLLAAPDVPGLGPHHVRAARQDLEDGVELAFAPAGDGQPFLLVLARAEPAWLAEVGAPFDRLARVAGDPRGPFGMLRPERRLATVADARALRADPVAPRELRDLLPATL